MFARGRPQVSPTNKQNLIFRKQRFTPTDFQGKQPCRLIACAPINWSATAKQASLEFFCSRGCGASDGGFTYARSKEVGSRRLTNRRLRFDGRGACPSSYREPRNTNRMGLRSTIRGDRDRADAGVPPQNLTAPTRGFVPAVCRRTDSASFSPSADGTKPLSGKGVAGVSLTG